MTHCSVNEGWNQSTEGSGRTDGQWNSILTELVGVVLRSHYCPPTSALPIVLELGSNTQSSAHCSTVVNWITYYGDQYLYG